MRRLARRRRCAGSTPGTWPVRWRLAAASAGLTLVILLALRRRDRPGRDAADPRRLQPRGAAAPPRPWPRELRIVYTPFGQPASAGPQLDDFVLPDDASVAGLRRRRQPDQAQHRRRRPRAAAARALRPTAACGSRPRGSSDDRRHRDRLRPVRAQPRPRRLDDRPALALHRSPGSSAAPCSPASPALAIAGRAMRPISSLTATAREIADTARPLPPHARAEGRRRGRRAGADARADAALARRRPRRARGGDAEAARVRRRRLARAAHAADQHPRQPRAAAGLARAARAEPRTGRWSTRRCAPRGG